MKATDHWAERIEAFRAREELLSLRGLYTIVYRPASQLVHAGAESLAGCVDREPRSGVYRVNRERSDRLVWAALAAPIFAHALLVSAEVLLWPDAEKVRAINDALLQQGDDPLDVPIKPPHWG